MTRASRRDAKEMPFLDHLEELRRVLIDSLIAVAAGVAATWVFSARVLELIITRTMPGGAPVIFLGPGEAFVARLQVALFLGLLVVLPFVGFRVWRFVVPGLLKEERAIVLPLVALSCVLFYAGGAFGLVVLVPIVVRLLLAFATEHMVPAIAVGQLLGLAVRLGLTCGLLFQLPLVSIVLTLAGVVTPEGLLGRWRHAVLGIFILAAVVTPGDTGASQFLLAVPVSLLYFASVGLSFAVRRRRRREGAGGGAGAGAGGGARPEVAGAGEGGR